MAGNATDARKAADARLEQARRSGSKEQIEAAQVARNIARDVELAATGGNRQAGER